MLQLRTTLLVLATYQISQSYGQTICACQPSRFTMTLNLDAKCENSTILSGAPGIYDAACSTLGPFSNSVPIGVSKVEISELDQSLKSVGTTVFNGTFKSGDSFRYSSVIATSRDDLISDPMARPRGLQVEVNGIDSNNVSIVDKWVVLFTNDCSISPVLSVGQQIGWTTFVSYNSGFALHFLFGNFEPRQLNYYLFRSFLRQ
jgi:hypothetical protein